MDGIHDLGGRQGFGGSLEERDEGGFHAEWEARVFAMASLLMGLGCFSVDAFRHGIERLDPVTYLSDGYYGRWLGAVERWVADADRLPEPGRATVSGAQREIDRPARFQVGDSVRTRNLHRSGHTRLPGYARMRRGTVALVHGGWVLPDTNAHDQGECPEHVYSVHFTGRELWGDSAEPATSVCVDLFESYLEPA